MPPPPSLKSDPPDTVERWIHQIGPIETSDIQKIQARLLQVMNRNGNGLNGNREWIGIDGPPMTGKTLSTIVAALRINDSLLESQATDVADPFTHIPVAIVSGNLGATPQARTLLDNIAAFLGVPGLPANLQVATRALTTHLQNVGTLLVVVDDAHFIKRQNGSRTLTDQLKDIVTTLPVTLAFVGAGLRHSALLHVPSERRQPPTAADLTGTTPMDANSIAQFSAVEQLRLRMIFHPVVEYPVDSNGAPNEVFSGRMHNFISELKRIDGFDAGFLDTKTAIKMLNHAARGRTGHGFSILRSIAAASVQIGEPPSRSLVRGAADVLGKRLTDG